ncbi:ankyrin repeat domain-containing protein [Micromonospora sp. NBC_01392]|uniref:hypothetical protein n=1 Tax=Micromonospora sp. NBC_01392 TaxID=2903588 RepID=UPI003252817E
MGDWDGVGLLRGGDVAQVRARLAAGADPLAPCWQGGRTMLHETAESASPAVVAAMARAAHDLDRPADGRSALWLAVHAGRADNARVLADAGADPWLPMMAGWSPGRLSLAGPEPALFTGRPADVALTPAEAGVAARAPRLRATFTGIHLEGTGLLSVAGIDTADVVRRLHATTATEDDLLTRYDVEVDEDFDPDADPDAWRWLEDIHDPLLIGGTDVPGGCVLTQPWGYQPQTLVVGRAVSAGTIAYGLFANPKSGNQGSVFTDAPTPARDLHPGGEPWEDATPDEILLSYLYRGTPAAYACAYVGLEPRSARPVTGPPDTWMLVPERDPEHR